jgi:transcriptional regulator with XRE-family HTH domain
VNEALTSASARRALAERDITTVYRILKETGVPQRQIAHLTGQSQSEVCEILRGRQVVSYDVLVRIAEGLDVPRSWMGLAYGEDASPPSPSVEEVDENVKRRALLATASVALLGAPALGNLLHIPAPPATPTPLPSRLGAADVAAIRSLTTELCTEARAYGGGADVVTAVAQRALLLRSVPASEELRDELASALAELHTIAGWCCMDSGHDDNARAHFAQAMDLAGDAGDGSQLASALRHAGIQMRDAGAYDDDLKACQLGLIKLGVVARDDARGQEQLSWLHGESAIALAAMGYREEALRAIATAREWTPSAPFDIADLDLMTAEVHLYLDRLDTAESMAAVSTRTFGNDRREGVLADIVLATIHTRTREPDSTVLAQRAITSVASLRSVRARASLAGLVQALDAQADSTSRDLAHHARRVSQV